MPLTEHHLPHLSLIIPLFNLNLELDNYIQRLTTHSSLSSLSFTNLTFLLHSQGIIFYIFVVSPSSSTFPGTRQLFSASHRPSFLLLLLTLHHFHPSPFSKHHLLYLCLITLPLQPFLELDNYFQLPPPFFPPSPSHPSPLSSFFISKTTNTSAFLSSISPASSSASCSSSSSASCSQTLNLFHAVFILGWGRPPEVSASARLLVGV